MLQNSFHINNELWLGFSSVIIQLRTNGCDFNEWEIELAVIVCLYLEIQLNFRFAALIQSRN